MHAGVVSWAVGWGAVGGIEAKSKQDSMRVRSSCASRVSEDLSLFLSVHSFEFLVMLRLDVLVVVM